jgi:LuxR family maltose regulon positive regulatory protein
MNKRSTRLALSPLRAAKLRCPAPSDHYVRRRRLLDLLDDVSRAPLTLVVAPAGAGKTALLAGWVRESPIPTAWLSLDEADRDPSQFWAGVIAAIETVAPGSGGRALAMLRRPGRFSASVVDHLLDDLDGIDRSPAALILDDFHAVADNKTVASSMAVFVRHQPAWLRLVLGSRRRPRLPIDRMRSRGQLGEIHFDELRFSPDEAIQLVTGLSPSLPEARIRDLVDRAGGWAASLQLAALAERSAQARRDVVPSEVVESLLLHDYVLDEVLAGE